MRTLDLIGFTALSLRRQRFRSLMMMLSVAMGVASVVVLVGLGEGARQYVMNEFAYIGKDVLAVFPGRKTTSGGMPPVTGNAARDITLEEAVILERTVPGIKAIAGVVAGAGEVAHGSRDRRTTVLGIGVDFFAIRNLKINGEIWDQIGLDEASPVAVIGNKLKQELFDNRRAIGQWIRIRDFRFRVIGVTAESGNAFGIDVGDTVFIPVASAQQVFNTSSLFRLAIQIDANQNRDRMVQTIEQRMQQLHDGELDVTVVNPDAMVASFDSILKVMTIAVAGIAAISLVVAGVLVMNLTLMSVQQRTAEIGLLKAIGASAAQVRLFFISEAVILALTGSAIGVLVASSLILIANAALPDFPLRIPLWGVLGASALATLTAFLFAWRPASNAAALPPIVALGRG